MDQNKKPSRFGTWESWSSWTSPVGLGIFLLTAALSLAIFLYAIMNLVLTVSEYSHPADTQQGLTQQELQQLESQQPAPTSGTGATTAQ